MLSVQFKNIQYTFHQLTDLLSSIEEKEYSKNISQLSDLSVGKHVRHCIEILENLILGIETLNISYDQRKRDPLYENSPLAARDKIFELLGKLESITVNKELKLTYLVNPHKGLEEKTITNVKREFLYVQDHTIHHMAIIKLYAECFLHNVSFPEEFGLALSTIQFRSQNQNSDS